MNKGFKMEMMEGFEGWSKMVAQFAAKHVQKGATMEQAIHLGIQEYTSYLSRLCEGISDSYDGFSNTGNARRASDSNKVIADLAYRTIRMAA